MRRLLFRTLFFLILGPCITGVIYLNFYPFFHGCRFPVPADYPSHYELNGSELHNPRNSDTKGETSNDGTIATTTTPATGATASTSVAAHKVAPPFRLLVFADPQLEGNTVLPRPDQSNFPSAQTMWTEFFSLQRLSLPRATLLLRQIFSQDLRTFLRMIRKKIDLVGNDFYLGHVYKTMYWWSNPTHTTVLGDLLGSQWISDAEFEHRSDRYWGRVFRGASKTDESKLSRLHEQRGDEERVEELGSDPSWSRRLLHVVGNHDVGYAGDMSEDRVNRFERRFGPVNGAITFTVPEAYLNESGNGALLESKTVPTLRIVVLNSMNLDTPAFSTSLQDETYRFLNAVMATAKPRESRTDAVVLLTHIPLYKPEGVCVDPPMFTFFPDSWSDPVVRGLALGGGLREQNHLSDLVSWNHILKGLFGMSLDPVMDGDGEGGNVVEWRAEGRKGIVLAGHDHEGCDVLHFLKPDDRKVEYSNGNGAESGDERDEDKESPSSVSISSIQPPIPSPTFYALRTPFPDPKNPPSAFDSFPLPEHHRPRDGTKGERRPQTPRYTPSPIREITARSMMGEYGGYSVLLSGWIDPGTGSWRFESRTCSMGTHHLWWTVIVVVLVTAGAGLLALVEMLVMMKGGKKGEKSTENGRVVVMRKETRKGAGHGSAGAWGGVDCQNGPSHPSSSVGVGPKERDRIDVQHVRTRR